MGVRVVDNLDHVEYEIFQKERAVIVAKEKAEIQAARGQTAENISYFVAISRVFGEVFRFEIKEGTALSSSTFYGINELTSITTVIPIGFCSTSLELSAVVINQPSEQLAT
jgi:hypothetical protein